MFAGDLLLFEQATKDSMTMVVKTLQDFCNMLGYQVNHAKLSTFFLPITWIWVVEGDWLRCLVLTKLHF